VLLGSLTIPGEPACLHQARDFAARTAVGACADVDSTVLLTSELVTNSMQHSNSRYPGGTVTISVIAVPDGIRIEVIDDGAPTVPAASIRQNDPPCLAEYGRGLPLVDALSARWGHYTDQAGTVTWFELAGEPHN
jgi:anti-sigma regulatory factor (Ser/Thr protein kinase)